MKKLNITKEQFRKFNESADDAVKELCIKDGANVVDATATIEKFNEKIYELTGKYVIDPDEFFATTSDLCEFIEDYMMEDIPRDNAFFVKKSSPSSPAQSL